MSHTFFIELERRAHQGWEVADWTLLPIPPAGSSDPRFDLDQFYDRTLYFVLTAFQYRVDPDDCPPPVFLRPRGVPEDLSPELARLEDEHRWLHHWCTPNELLLYDWGAYEPFFEQRRREHVARYEARHGRPPPPRTRPPPRHHLQLLDAVAALEPFDEYRLLFGME